MIVLNRGAKGLLNTIEPAVSHWFEEAPPAYDGGSLLGRLAGARGRELSRQKIVSIQLLTLHLSGEPETPALKLYRRAAEGNYMAIKAVGDRCDQL